MKFVRVIVVCIVLAAAAQVSAFDGSKWNISTGNMSLELIKACPIGVEPKAGVKAPDISAEDARKSREAGLMTNEDYIAWAEVEAEQGKWDFSQHDKICSAFRAGGLHYVVYNWAHFPPMWLRNGTDRTLMRCVEHKQDTYYLSIFDPRTIGYYDHFYKAIHDHFADRIDSIYACILGPYGEGNYPIGFGGFVEFGHCHEGYWCQDPYAIANLRDAMRVKYGRIGSLNKAWGVELTSFVQVLPPHEIAEGVKPSPEAFRTPQDRRRWLDFITWYHQAMIDFAEKSINVVARYYPLEKIRIKPGGNSEGANPISWGTYCPGYAKMAAKYGIVLQPADFQGAYFGDKWVGTAYQFYGVTMSTEPWQSLEHPQFIRRMFSEASVGAGQLFVYQYWKHADDVRKYIHLYTGKQGNPDLAIYFPTTLYRLGGDAGATVKAGSLMRDITDFDVLDELLIQDGALNGRYRTLLMFQGDCVEQAILDKIEAWVKRGGTLVVCGGKPVLNVDGEAWAVASTAGRVVGFASIPGDEQSASALYEAFGGSSTRDGKFDGVWTTRRGAESMLLNNTDAAVSCEPVAGRKVTIEPHSILSLSR